jgi:hydroxyacylglutathione hydrolase
VLLRQFVDEDLGCGSYLLVDEQTRAAAVVDPAYEIEPYLEQAERDGATLTCVIETHTHADHVSGHGRLALEHGLTVHVHPEAHPGYPFEPLGDGQKFALGAETIRVLHTPGHRPEHCCLVAGDAVLTGDSLFVGSVARPDLAVEAREGAVGLFHSLQRLLELPDAFRVYPGHVAGSLCGSGMSGDPSSTIGTERRLNPALALSLMEEFVDSSAAVSTPRPPTMARVVELNRGPFLGAQDPLAPVADAGDAIVLDVRPPREFVAGHVHGAINVPVSGTNFGTKTGFILEPGERVVVHAASADEADRAARRLRAAGILELDGYLEGAEAQETIDPVSVEELDRLLAEGAVVLDVREHDERSQGFISGTRHVPYRLLRACSETLPRDRPVVTLCESGARAAIGASVLKRFGIDARPVLDGGITEWQAEGGSLVEMRRCGQSP